MPQERTEAIVIKGVDYSESSRVITFLTPERGILSCFAAGIHKKRSHLKAVLNTLNKVEIVYYWKEGRELQRLSEAFLIDGYLGIKNDVLKFILEMFPLEIIQKSVQKNEPAQKIFSLLDKSLKGLENWTKNPLHYICWEVVQIMMALGFAPKLEQPQTGEIGFDYEIGLTYDLTHAQIKLTDEVVSDFNRLAKTAAECPYLSDAKTVFICLKNYVSRHVGSNFKSLTVIEQLKGRNLF